MFFLCWYHDCRIQKQLRLTLRVFLERSYIKDVKESQDLCQRETQGNLSLLLFLRCQSTDFVIDLMWQQKYRSEYMITPRTITYFLVFKDQASAWGPFFLLLKKQFCLYLSEVSLGTSDHWLLKSTFKSCSVTEQGTFLCYLHNCKRVILKNHWRKNNFQTCSILTLVTVSSISIGHTTVNGGIYCCCLARVVSWIDRHRVL